MSRARRSAYHLMVVVFSAAIVGCSGMSSGVSLRGKISYHGQPLAHASVMFFPEHGRAVAAVTDRDGAYRVELAPGEYAVTVNVSVQLPPGWQEGDPVPPQTNALPTQYTTRINTPLKTTVSANGAQPTDFVLP